MRPHALLLAAALILTQGAFGAETPPPPSLPPTETSPLSWGSRMSYRVLGFAFKALEKSLEDAGLDVQVCSFTSFKTGKTFSAKGMGECLFQNFKEGLRNKGPVGVTYLWANTPRHKILSLRVDWRPSEEGLLKMAEELLTLKFEGVSRWWSRHVSKNSAEERPLPYSQNILGNIRLTLPPGTTLADFISKPPPRDLPEIGLAAGLEFQLTPLYKVDGHAHYQGLLRVIPEAPTQDENGQWVLEFKTDFNFLKTSRPFQVKGHFDGGLEEEPQP